MNQQLIITFKQLYFFFSLFILLSYILFNMLTALTSIKELLYENNNR